MVSYQIVGGNGSALFKIGLCDGQIRLINSGTLNFNVANVYELEILAVPDGVTASNTTTNITVQVLYVNKPPVFNDTGFRSVYENETAGVLFGAPVTGHPLCCRVVCPRAVDVCACVCVCVFVYFPRSQ